MKFMFSYETKPRAQFSLAIQIYLSNGRQLR